MNDVNGIHVKAACYPYPRTIAEMILAREAEFRERARDQPDCPRHGRMEFSPLKGQSYESLLCGIRFDCAHPGCTSSATWPSREQAYDCGHPYNSGSGWEKFNGQEWVTAGKDEVDAYWAAWEVAGRIAPRWRGGR